MIDVIALKRLWYKKGQQEIQKGDKFAVDENEIESLEALGLVERKPEQTAQTAKAPTKRKALDNGNS